MNILATFWYYFPSLSNKGLLPDRMTSSGYHEAIWDDDERKENLLNLHVVAQVLSSTSDALLKNADK